VRILIPMVGNLDQLRRSIALLERAREALRAEGLPCAQRPPVGPMIELPSAVLISDILARESDFFSIGSNDLIQYSLAVDRGNARIAQLYDPLDPAVLRAIDVTLRNARPRGIPVGSCGELSGELPGLLLLVGLGVADLSVAPALVRRTKAILGQVAAADLESLAQRSLAADDAGEVWRILAETLGRDQQFVFEERDGQRLCRWDPETS
jgi:phosphotransferase system enzyme I (PtsI)